MKKFLKCVLSIFLILFFMVGITSCDNSTNENINPDDSTVDVIPTVDKFTVSFDNQGHGSKPQDQTVEKNQVATEPTVLTETGWTFEGWYTDSTYQQKYSFSTAVVANIVLYAKWTKVETTVPTVENVTIYLAGDSTVQSYAETQYIAGWGQYLDLFLDDSVTVVNAARGGRSSRSFINEDRLFASSDATYSFSENNGKSIEETIKEGDYLFVQFGHNDDSTKGYTTMPDRMVPLGTPDANGIYPVTAPTEQKSTSYLPTEYTSLATTTEVTKMQTEIAKYGSTYYAYGDGTYKWYLKQYIDLARSKGAIPVLMTPVARVKFSGSEIIGGPGLHGDNFAYVEAVRQLANEENCLLIDNFAGSKELLETATSTYADYLMAIVPNALDNGPWPTGYDNAYGNANAGFEKIEATHYNKYGAFLTTAYVVEQIIKSQEAGVKKGTNDQEEFTFVSHLKTSPESYIDPSNRISISTVESMEDLFEKVNPTNPSRTYVQPQVAIDAIQTLVTKGGISTITSANYEEWKAYCEEVRSVYESINYDLRSGVTNYSTLVDYEAAVVAARPKADKIVVLSASDYVDPSTPITVLDHTFSFHSTIESYSKKSAQVTYNDVKYVATTQAIRLKGNGSVTSDSPQKYIEFTLEKACTVTIIASGGSDTARHILMVDSTKKTVADYEILPSQTLVSHDISTGGTYRIASSGSNIDVYYVIIEYYN